MLIATVCIIAAIAAVVFGRPALRTAREGREARAREERRKAEAFMSAQRAYFSGQGIRIVDDKMSPRQADIGTIRLSHETENRWQSDDDGSWHSTPIVCDHGCGTRMVFLHEVAPANKDGSGAAWGLVGSYCASCGAWRGGASGQRSGPLKRIVNGTTNLFDALGDPGQGTGEEGWRKLEAEIGELEARLNDARARRLALAEQLGKPIDGGPFRPRLVEKTGT
ncbi:MAG TPA: hypothetical protein VL283_01195 [Candidatus Baltobacteraceae bacterium]|nr:hypothetical protein [Candidatus Baltobacteraceae bacterium]